MNRRSLIAFDRLAIFSVTLVLAFYFYYLLSPVYGRLVLTLSGFLLRPFAQAPAMVSYAEQQGILVTSSAFKGAMAFKFDLFSICLNVVFAPALVIMTTGLRGWGWLRVIVAVLIMMLLHAAEVVVTLLRFLTENSNPLILAASAAFAGFAKWLYSFFDKMGYTLFPFLAWLIVCAGELARWAGGKTGEVPVRSPADQNEKIDRDAG